MTNLSLAQRRGFEFSYLEQNTLGLLLIKGSIEKISPVLTEVLKGKLKIDILNQEHNWYREPGLTLFQYREHPWTIVFAFDICAKKTVGQISKILNTYCIYLQHEDTSSCSGYYLYEAGKCIEEFQWGVSYVEEFWEVTEDEFFQFALDKEAQGDPLPYNWNPKNWDVYCFEGYSSYTFRSKINTATKEEVIKVERFLNFLFLNLDVWLPDAEYFPDEGLSQSDDNYLVKSEDFVRVDIISNPMSVNEVRNLYVQ